MVKRILAVILLGLMCFSLGVQAGKTRDLARDYSSYSSSELTWIEEGIMERISKLEDELDKVREMERNVN